MAPLLPASSPPPLSTSSSSSSLSEKFEAVFKVNPRNGLGGALKRWLGLGLLLVVTVVLGLGLRKNGQGLTEVSRAFLLLAFRLEKEERRERRLRAQGQRETGYAGRI
jgi:hypothetical protein